MLRETRIILPLRTNDGKPLDWLHARLKRQLAEKFGGYTAFQSFGGWVDPKSGKLIEEASVTYDVAAPEQSENYYLQILCEDLTEAAQQECIYLRLPTGSVNFIEAAKVD